MVIAIIDNITSVEEVCLLQSHGMNTLVDSSDPPIQAFSDDSIAATINNVIDFVYANIPSTADAGLIRFCVKSLSVLALNNIMFESGYLPNWERIDPFNKDNLQQLLRDTSESVDSIKMISDEKLVSDIRKSGYIYGSSSRRK